MPSNEGTIRIIIGTMAVLALVAVLTICALSVLGDKIPPELNTIAGGLVGSLGSMLVKTSASAQTPNVGQ